MFISFRTPLAALLLGAASLVLAAASAAQAQTVRFVASNGNDNNNCTRTAPCRTLQRGIDATPNGGELQILNSGTYGNAATIRRSITISAVGVAATVGRIRITRANATVVLRGLLLTGRSLPADTNGIDIVRAASVHIVRCEIERFSGDGVNIEVDDVEVFISDTVSRQNNRGLFLSANSSGARLTIDNSRFENNDVQGILAAGGSGEVAVSRVVVSGNTSTGITATAGRMTVTSTTAANNGADGFVVFNPLSRMTVESSVARGNGQSGLLVNSGIARVSNSVFTDNGTGLRRLSGTLLSRSNNTVTGNGTDVDGTITPLPGV